MRESQPDVNKQFQIDKDTTFCCAKKFFYILI